MAHHYIKKRFNVPYNYYQQNGSDGEDTLFLPEQSIKGFGMDEVKNIVNFKGDKYQSGSQLYFDGDNALALQIRGGDFLENDFMGKILVQAIRHYYKRVNRINTEVGTELIVVYL